jgi:hypothetical protein
MVRRVDLAWAAGFLEGEGYFTVANKYRNIQAGANQVQRWPLDRLHQIFNVGTFFIKQYHGVAQDQWVWSVQGTDAIALMMTLYPLMSPRRQEQIRHAIAVWKTWRVSNKYKTKCDQGHELSGTNLILHNRKSNGHVRRVCRMCQQERQRLFAREKRTSLKEAG